MKSTAFAILITTALITTASAQLRPKHRFTLNADHLTQAIVKALAQSGIEAGPTHIALLGDVLATDPLPSFQIVSIQPQLNTTHTAIKLSCLRPATCLPFYVLVDVPTTGRLSRSLPSASTTKPSIVMRAGTSATLLMDDGREHLQLSVISMESGPAGRTIRVRTPDHKRTFSAQILSAQTLEARF